MLLAGVLGLSGCGNSSTDPSTLSDNLKAINSYQVMSMTRNAEAQFANVVKISKHSKNSGNSSIVLEALLGARDFEYERVYDSTLELYSDQMQFTNSAFNTRSEENEFVKLTVEGKNNATIWYGAAEDTSLTDQLSCYYKASSEDNQGRHTESCSTMIANFATSETVGNTWSTFRAYQVTNLLGSDAGYASAYSYGMDGDTLVGYYISAVESTASSPYAPSNSDIVVRSRLESKTIVKYVNDSTYGWVLHSRYTSSSTSYLTDMLGKELSNPIETQSSVNTSILEYGESKAAGDLPIYVAENNKTVFVNTYDVDTSAYATKTILVPEIGYSQLFTESKETKNYYTYRSYFNIGDKIVLSNYANQSLETPDYEVWGYSNLNVANSLGVSDAKVAEHDLINIDYSGNYSIQIVMDSEGAKIESFSIVYIGD